MICEPPIIKRDLGIPEAHLATNLNHNTPSTSPVTKDELD